MRIGILGAGQLGRMLALEGYRLGHEFSLYDPAGKASAGVGRIYNDPDGSQLEDFLQSVDRITYEFEHLPMDLVERIAHNWPVDPPPRALGICQNRRREKSLFRDLGIPTADFHTATSAQELKDGASSLDGWVVAKSVTDGYDGKGQAVLSGPDEAAQAWSAIGHTELVVEQFVNFRRELSIVAARGSDGEMAFYPLVQNIHHDGILRFSVAPAPGITPELESEAQRMIRSLMNELDYRGVLALELFETDEKLLANEMAPRVHNSGHWSLNGAVTSQFENHIRAVSGLPLGETAMLAPTCMINLVGETGPIPELLRLPYTHLHLYGKTPKPGRKIGHINILADSMRELRWRAMNTASLIPGCPEFECLL